MTAWDINPDGVKTVLEHAHTAAMPIENHAKAYGTAMTALCDVGHDGTPELGIIMAVPMSDFVRHFEYAFSDISAQVIASLKGAADATLAYMNGQHDIALSAQRNSRDAASKEAEVRAHAPEGQAGQLISDQAAQQRKADDAMKNSDAPGYRFLRWADSVSDEVFGGGDAGGGD